MIAVASSPSSTGARSNATRSAFAKVMSARDLSTIRAGTASSFNRGSHGLRAAFLERADQAGESDHEPERASSKSNEAGHRIPGVSGQNAAHPSPCTVAKPVQAPAQ